MLTCLARSNLAWNASKNIPSSAVLIHNIDASHRRHSSGVSSSNAVRIGCASGFWGDTSVAAPQLINHGKLDYIVFDYLSEITMSLLTAAKNRNPDLGYTPDFVHAAMLPNLKSIKEKGIKVIANAGGVNPEACAKLLKQEAEKKGFHFKIATVTGDNLMDQLPNMESCTDIDTGLPIPKTVQSMNAYLGAGPIVQALEMGADIVITGRCTDSALVLAPLIYQHKWPMNDFERLAQGSLAGHLIECGAQVTGGIHTDWKSVRDWWNIGFPIVEVKENGKFKVTKPPNTGGAVSFGTVAEQLTYEIGDPKNYILPDVVCDLTHVHISHEEAGEHDHTHNVIRVDSCHGQAPTPTYKVCGTYFDGYRALAVCPVGGPNAAAKGKRVGVSIFKRMRAMYKQLGFDDFDQTNVEVLGGEKIYGAHNDPKVQSKDAVLWIGAQHQNKAALELFSREIASAGTGMAPGLTTIVGGRPKVTPILKLFSFLYPKENVKVMVSMDDDTVEYKLPDVEYSDAQALQSKKSGKKIKHVLEGTHTFRLEDLAYTRSGDKGNSANIGVIARDISLVPYLREALTAEAVEEYFQDLWSDRAGPVSDRVIRYEMPGIGGFNFLMKNCLGGGGVASLRHDPQGKALGQQLLDFEIHNAPDLLDHDHH